MKYFAAIGYMSLNHLVGAPSSVTAAAANSAATADYPHTYAPLRLSTVAQATSTATGVTLSARSGVVTMFAGTIAAAAVASFTVTNNLVSVGSLVRASVVGGAQDAASCPVVSVRAIAAGSFVVVVTNVGTAATGANSILVAFEILG